MMKRYEHTKHSARLLLMAALIPCLSFAQGTHVTKKRVSRPVSWLYLTHEFEADFQAEGYSDNPDDTPSVSLQQTSGGMTFPLLMNDRIRLMSGLRAAWYHFEFQHVALADIDAWSVSIPFTAIMPATEKLSFMANVSPGIYTDFERVNHNDLKTSFLLLGNYTWSENLTLSAGCAYSRVFGEDEFFPAAGLDWQPNESWSVRLMFPTPGITYYINPRSRIALGFSPAGGKWNIRDPRSKNSTNEEYDFEFKGWRSGLGYEYDLTDRLTLVVDLGATLRREYTIENDDGTLLDSDVDDTLSARIGLLLHR
jgi:hypothetical protein